MGLFALAAAVAAGPARAADGDPVGTLRDLVRVEHGSVAAPAEVPAQARLGRTRLELAIPVHGALRVRPGVRLDYVTESGATRDARTLPTLGLELRF
jgi:hypothetical protein